MADNRWINTNGGNWSDGANWSLGVKPTASDNAIVDASSFNATGKTITINEIANCLNLDLGGADVTFTLANAAYALNVYGNLIDSTNRLAGFTGTGYLYFKATTTGKTITSNGNTVGWNRVYFDGVGGEWVNQDDWNTATSAIFTSNGTINTNGKTIRWNDMYRQSGSFTFNFSSSTIYANWINQYASTINAGTSTIISTGQFFSVGTAVYYNVTINNPRTGSGLAGTNTYNNFTINGDASILSYIHVAGTHTINGVLTIAGSNASNNRLLIASNTIGTSRTITCNGTITASNVDFRDITLAGSANRDLSAITGGSGDCGGNSGITFTAAQPQWYKHTSGACTWKDATKWFQDAAKTIAGRVPLPQDDATFDATSFTGTSTLTVDCPRIGRSLDMSAVNQAVTFSLANAIECYGSYVLGSSITPSGNYYLYLLGRGSYNFNTHSKSFYGVIINCTTGNYINLSTINAPGNTSSVISGAFDFNDYSVNMLALTIQGGIVYLGNGVFTLTITYATAFASFNTTLHCENSTIKLSATSGVSDITLNGGSKTLNKVWISGSHTGNYNIQGSNTISELIIDAGRKVRFTAATNTTIGKLTAIGTEASPITISSVTTAQHTLTKTGVGVNEIKYCNISYSNAVGGFTAENSVDGGNNTGWVFITGYKMYIGALQVQKMYIGENLVTTAYLGNNLLK